MEYEANAYLLKDGKIYRPGDIIDLEEDQAKNLGEKVKDVPKKKATAKKDDKKVEAQPAPDLAQPEPQTEQPKQEQPAADQPAQQ